MASKKKQKLKDATLKLSGGVIFQYDVRDDVLYIESGDQTINTMIMGASKAGIVVTFFEGYPNPQGGKDADDIQIAVYGGCVMHCGGTREEARQLAAIVGVRAEEEDAPTPEEWEEIGAEVAKDLKDAG